ncbi:hypothetical protein THIOM_001968 [Candidatus Thiomargarita nelsonii]|uniref:Uncharacterized protein n=1 Tax=Candidatus Thiomargarita nelsonii TaxID=1003181 RepID=A0A176S2T8_9GAMM|nr:hypothetical protein THIOM_001968 [Candidatus Thiomargarita nelsonii]
MALLQHYPGADDLALLEHHPGADDLALLEQTSLFERRFFHLHHQIGCVHPKRSPMGEPDSAEVVQD